MPFLTALVVFVGLLCTLDLILTLGVIKRLREHTELLTAPPPTPAVPVGGRIADFATTTVDGEPLSQAMFVRDTLVAFFSPSCGPCKDKLPAFVSYARNTGAAEDRPVAVVVGDRDQAAGFISSLAPVARVVVEDPEGAMGLAFKAEMFPTLLKVAPDGEGALVVTDNQVELEKRPMAGAAAAPADGPHSPA
ncbi:hypothetical protein NLX86_16975 [Streptomyces sp. A3M-1-3]|uniref:hypothetical protein n=1 Tax=Streptomyces sp. A3M-1-3 TaxID=2962044 RepID=UPI0020B6EE0A|nr:hypothetical protein [Streptomyces sp. A3M-1-3]MCP3819729.1 hypothetical protein [Streptomyces sp. A3M-1-3]